MGMFKDWWISRNITGLSTVDLETFGSGVAIVRHLLIGCYLGAWTLLAEFWKVGTVNYLLISGSLSWLVWGCCWLVFTDYLKLSLMCFLVQDFGIWLKEVFAFHIWKINTLILSPLFCSSLARLSEETIRHYEKVYGDMFMS